MAIGKTTPLAERFARYVQRTDDVVSCWLWTGAVNTNGYGVISRGRRMVLAHRLAWELAYGAIPATMRVLHACDHPLCVRSDHLFLGTLLDNTRDMITKGRDRMIGERHPSARLTEIQVREIRHALEPGITLAKRFGVSTQTICGIRKGRRWKHLRDTS